jgi:DNA-binding PadR family transcriptional regulator
MEESLARQPRTELMLAEWAVLGVVGEGATHGWALARVLGQHGQLGQAWTMTRPLVYRAVASLRERGLVRPVGADAVSLGPQRTILALTSEGDEALRDWLTRPVEHVRDIRTEFLVKLILLERRGDSAAELIQAQRDQLRPVVARLSEAAGQADGADRPVALWRAAAAAAALSFLDSLEPSRTGD